MEALLAVWPVVVVIGAVAVWALRLESLVKINKTKQENIEARIQTGLNHLEARVDRQDNEIEKRLAKIDGRLEGIATSLERVIWRIPRTKDDRPDQD